MVTISDIIEKYRSYRDEDTEIEKIKKAYELARDAHEGQQRKSKAPYIIHPLSVALTLAKLELDWEVICAALLHDTIEDTNLDSNILFNKFGAGVASLVESLTKIKSAAISQHSEKKHAEIESMRKIILGAAQDVRVLLIKLSDRWDNLKTLEHLSRDRQKSIAQETIDIYAPIANKLGLTVIREDMENLCFKYLKPRQFIKFEQRRSISKKFIAKPLREFKKQLQIHLREANLDNTIIEHYQTPYQIYSKTMQKIQPKILDFIIMVPTVRDCYLCLGVLHEHFTPLPDSTIKDFISVPRSNGYQSLHTKILCYETIFSVKIRTAEMDEVANYGILAKVDGKSFKELQIWIDLLKDIAADELDSKRFIKGIQDASEADRIYVSTPKGDYWSFPRNAIVLDFAYRIHTDIGNQCQGAIMDDQHVDIADELRDGAIVRVITSRDVHPKTEWLNKVKTPRARNAIRNWLETQKRIRSRDFGKKILSLEMNRYNLILDDIIKTPEMLEIIEKTGAQNFDDFFSKIGRGILTTRDVITHFVSPKDLKRVLKKETSRFPGFFQRFFKEHKSQVFQITDIHDAYIKLSKCCNPLPGDEIIGVFSKKHGISVHRINCEIIKNKQLNNDQTLHMTWDLDTSQMHPTRYAIRGDIREKLLVEIFSLLFEKKITVLKCHLERSRSDTILELELETLNADQAELILHLIEKIKGVQRIQRL